MEIFEEIEQGQPEWYTVRMGLPTASRFADVMAKKGPRGGIPKGRQTYLWKLAGEILTGEPMDSYTNFSIERGKEQENEARTLYAFLKDADVQQVGFIRNGNCGCSPDGLLGNDGMYETKSAAAHIQIERLLKGGLPPEHKAQCQGALMVAQREWIDFMSYCWGLPPLIVRVVRDEAFIAALRIDINDFVDELHELVEHIRSL